MVSSNNPVDFINVIRASGGNVEEFLKSEEAKTFITEHLSENELTVTFTKKDGTQRVMRCTRNVEKIPSDKQPTTSSKETDKTDAVRVFDLDIQEWRSFNLSSVTRFDWDMA